MHPPSYSPWRILALLYLASQSLAIQVDVESSNVKLGGTLEISWETERTTPGQVAIQEQSTGNSTTLAVIDDMRQTRSLEWDVPWTMNPGPYTIHVTTDLDGDAEPQEIKLEYKTAVEGLNGLEPGARAGAIAGITIGVLLILAASIWCCCWSCCCSKAARAKRAEKGADRFSNHEASVGLNKSEDASSTEYNMANLGAHRQQVEPEMIHEAAPSEPPPAYHELK